MGFGDLKSAADMRDIIRDIALGAVSDAVSAERFGRVISIDFAAQKASVWFPGDLAPVQVKFFSSTIPGDWEEKYSFNFTRTSTQGHGSIVSVVTLNGSQYITGVLNGGEFSVDYRAGGFVDMRYDTSGNPVDPSGADYVFKAQWGVDANGALLPNKGGPYAINIGPFLYNETTWPAGGSHEIEVALSSGKSQRYNFTMDPYWLMSRNNAVTPTDRWYRLIPDKYNEDNFSSNLRKINSTSGFSVAAGLGDWQAYNANVVVTASNAETHGGADIGSMQVVSANGTTGTITASTGLTTPARYPTMPSPTYSISFWVKSPQGAFAGTIGAAIDWYDASASFVGTTSAAATITLSGTSWQQYTGTISGLVLGVTGVLRLSFNGTPPLTRFYYVDEIAFTETNTVSKTDFSVDVALRKTIHGSYDTDPAHSQGEMWIRIYIHFVNYIQNLTFTVRVKNTAAWSSPKSNKTKKPVYEYITSPTDAVGYLGYTDAGAALSTSTSGYDTAVREASTGPWRNPDLIIARRIESSLTCAGEFSVDTANNALSFGTLSVSGIGRSRGGIAFSNGSISVSQPSTSSVIPVLPGSGTVTVLSTGIPLTAGQSLWYAMPPGIGVDNTDVVPSANYYMTAGTNLREVGGFFIVTGSADWWSPPEWAVFIAKRDGNTGAKWRIANGQTIAQHEYPNKGVTRFILGVGQTISTTSATYADMTGLSTTFNKNRSDTALFVEVSLGHRASAVQLAEIGVRIDSTDYDVTRYLFNTNVLNTHLSAHGANKLTGIVKGSKTIQMRWRIAGGATLQFDVNDLLTLTVEECY